MLLGSIFSENLQAMICQRCPVVRSRSVRPPATKFSELSQEIKPAPKGGFCFLEHLQQLATDLKLMRTQIRIPGLHNSIDQFVQFVARAARDLAVHQRLDEVADMRAVEDWQIRGQGDRLGRQRGPLVLWRSQRAMNKRQTPARTQTGGAVFPADTMSGRHELFAGIASFASTRLCEHIRPAEICPKSASECARLQEYGGEDRSRRKFTQKMSIPPKDRIYSTFAR